MKNFADFVLKSILICIILSLCCTMTTLNFAKADDAYYEIKSDGRIYVFTSSAGKADFERSGEIGKGTIKIGHGLNGEPVIFDSDDAVGEYDKRLKVNKNFN